MTLPAIFSARGVLLYVLHMEALYQFNFPLVEIVPTLFGPCSLDPSRDIPGRYSVIEACIDQSQNGVTL